MVLELTDVRKAYGDRSSSSNSVNLHVERGDRIALVAPNGAGKSTLMRLLAGAEAPDAGTRREGHQVVMQYFAQDEANRLEPTKTVYETMEADSPVGMVPMIRNILGGFLFSGDDIYKKAGVLSGGERTRLAVARMLLRPANTLLLDEPTNHLDLDSKDVLLEALEDFGGTLIFVSHDRYFVDRLATKIVAVGHGGIEVYPGTYEQFLWSRTARVPPAAAPAASGSAPRGKQRYPPRPRRAAGPTRRTGAAQRPATAAEAGGARRVWRQRRRLTPRRRRRQTTRATDERNRRIADLEGRITEREQAIKRLEAQMSAPGFYDNREAADTILSTAPHAHVGGRRPHEPVGSPPGPVRRPSNPRRSHCYIFVIRCVFCNHLSRFAAAPIRSRTHGFRG